MDAHRDTAQAATCTSTFVGSSVAKLGAWEGDDEDGAAVGHTLGVNERRASVGTGVHGGGIKYLAGAMHACVCVCVTTGCTRMVQG